MKKPPSQSAGRDTKPQVSFMAPGDVNTQWVQREKPPAPANASQWNRYIDSRLKQFGAR